MNCLARSRGDAFADADADIWHLPLHLQAEHCTAQQMAYAPDCVASLHKIRGCYARTSLVNEAAPLNTGLAKQGSEVPAVRRRSTGSKELATNCTGLSSASRA
jgi:hypothetical protein